MADLSIAVSQEALRIAEQLTVPTRLYFPSTAPADVSPAFDAAWQETAAAVRRELVADGRKRGTAAASVTVTSTATNPEEHLHAQYISPPLRAQTISGNISGQFRALESNASFNGTLQIGIRVVSQDGATVRATLLAVGGSTTTGTTPPEFTTALTNRRVLTSGDVTPVPIASYTCREGDRLVIEIGSNDKDAGAARTAGISFGDNTNDLPVNDTTTTANDPWIEFDSTIRFLTAVDTVRLSDGGTTALMNPGWIKIADTVTAALQTGADLSRNLGDTENLKIADSVTASRGLTASVAEAILIADSAGISGGLGAAVAEALTLAEGPAARTLDPEQASPTESARVVDSVTVLIVLNVAVAEALRLGDIGQGRTELQGVVRIADGPPNAALIAAGGLSTAVSDESLRLADTVTAARDLTGSIAEAVTVADALTVARDVTASLAEAVRLAETGAQTLDPLASTAAEALRLGDSVQAAVFLAADLAEALALADGPASRTLDPLLTAPSEAVRAVDVVSIDANRTVLVTEALGIADAVSAVFATLIAAPSETVLLADGPPAIIGTLAVVVGVETLKLSDRVVILQAILTESLLLSDVGMGQTSLIGTIRMQDGPPVVALSNRLGAAASEGLTLAETLIVIRDPLEATASETMKLGIGPGSEAEIVRDEWVTIGESVTAALGATSDLFTSLTDALRLIDGPPVPARTLEQIATEAVVLSDTPTAARGLTVTVTAEAGLLADAVTAARDQIAVLQETGLLADTVASSLDPEATSAAEAVTVTDVVAADRIAADSLSVSLPADALRLSDVVTAARGLTVSLQDDVRIADLPDVQGPPILATASETLRLAETANRSYTPLALEADEEDVRLTDTLSATLATTLVVAIDTMALSDDGLIVGLDLSADPGGGGPTGTIGAAAPRCTWKLTRRQTTWTPPVRRTNWRVTMQSTLPPVDPKGPSEGKLYSMDWSGALNPGATILDSVWTTHPAGLTTALEGIVTGLTKTSARFTGGHRGVTYQVTNTISTSDGETLKRTGEIKVKDQ